LGERVETIVGHRENRREKKDSKCQNNLAEKLKTLKEVPASRHKTMGKRGTEGGIFSK